MKDKDENTLCSFCVILLPNKHLEKHAELMMGDDVLILKFHLSI